MHKKWKKIIVFALVLTMLMPMSSIVANSTDDEVDTDSSVELDGDADTEEEDADDSADDEADDEALPLKKSDEEALKFCKEVASNEKYILYYDDGEREEPDETTDEESSEEASEEVEVVEETTVPRIGLMVKETGKIWWSNPINIFADDTIVNSVKGNIMKETQRLQVASNLIMTYADLRQEKRNTKDLYSADDASEKWSEIDNGIKVEYKYTRAKITVPVTYVLEEGGLRVSVDTTKIEEKNTSSEDGKVLQSLALAPQFGAAPATDLDGNKVEGYMIVPDGSGAVINYNNGKTDYNVYSQKLYGRDYTAVPLTAPKVTDQAYLPVIATVSGNEGLVAIATDGDANASVNAQICGQSNQTYNTCYFSFELRSSDIYYMGGSATSKLTVFEKGEIGTPKVSVLYVPVSADDGVNYADVAEAYRNYLVKEDGLTSSTEENDYNFYLDVFGGVMKKKSILGIPFNLKTSMTSFEEAAELVNKLNDSGVDNIVVSYNDWTNKLIKKKVSTKFNPSGTLGGDGDYEDMESQLESVGAELYPTLNNLTMNSSSIGYWSLTNTAIRVSNAYSRQSSYSIAFGVEEVGVSPALLTPNCYGKMFDEIIDSFSDEDKSNVSFGEFSTALVSDFAKKEKSVRNDTMNTIIQGYEDATNGGLNKILCDGANGYLIKYASHITDVPIYSSGYNLTDYDIPLYQMVVHGYVPYSSPAINKCSDVQEAFLLSVAYGSALHYDMFYEDADEIADTDYDDLYYAQYGGWISTAAAQNSIAKGILAPLSKMTISDFQRDGDVITTTYSGEGKTDVKVVVDLENVTISVDGVYVDLNDISMIGGLLG